jgi:hypothetical protein
MYKYKVQYRVYLSNSKPGDNHPHLSGRKDLEFQLKERLVLDGPGRWKNTLINVIKQNDPSVTYVYDDMTVKDLGVVKISNSSTGYKETSEERESNYAAQVERNRIDREARWVEKDRKAAADERQRLIDIEESRIRSEEKAREKRQRQLRADELRAQGKNTQAFFVEYSEFVYGTIAILVFVGLLMCMFLKQGNEKQEAIEINQKLEIIEDQIRLALEEGDKDKALDLTNQLVHPLHVDMEHLDFDIINGYPKFDEYWTKKREEYKKLIFDEHIVSEDEKVELTKDEAPIEEKVIYEESTYVPTELDTVEGLDPEYQEN